MKILFLSHNLLFMNFVLSHHYLMQRTISIQILQITKYLIIRKEHEKKDNTNITTHKSFKWRKITKNIYKYWQTYSGSKYPAVPLTSNEAPLSPSCGAYLEKPRSVNLPHMLWSKRILLDFTSLCMMHRSEKVCRYNKPKSYRKENKIWQLSLIS